MEFLQKALTSLAQRDLSTSRKYALQALESDPSLAVANRVLAVAGVLLAGDCRLRNDRRDFYAILQLGSAESADPRLVWTQFEKLGTLVTPRGNDEDVPYAAEAHDLLFEAWSVISDEEKKSRYDAVIGGTFWTVCPYCYHMFEYGKVYEECCLRCQKCERAFHGVPIGEPSPETVVPGKDQYYFCYGIFPLGYKTGDFNVNMNGNVSERKEAVVEVSDDDSSDSSTDFGSTEGEEDSDGFWKEVMKNGSESQSKEMRVDVEELGKKKFVKVRARRMKNVKSVASKKAKISRGSEAESGKESDEDEGGNGGGELVFYEGDDDLFVGFEGTP